MQKMNFLCSLINQVVANKYNSPFTKLIISDPPSFEDPYTLSTNDIGTYKKKKFKLRSICRHPFSGFF